jgi:hypothetical protein
MKFDTAFLLGAELGAIAKLMPFCLEMVTEEKVAAALNGPRQNHGLDITEVMRRLAQLTKMWELLSEITVIAERSDFTEEILASLESKTIAFNIWWRDTFGTLNFLIKSSLTFLILGERACTYKIHKLVHLSDSIRNCGPLRYTWVFAFERGNLVAAKSIHRRDRTYLVVFYVHILFLVRTDSRRCSLRCNEVSACL